MDIGPERERVDAIPDEPQLPRRDEPPLEEPTHVPEREKEKEREPVEVG